MEIQKKHAKQIYDSVPDGFKRLLEAEFGVETFRKIDFRDLKTFEDLCEDCGTTSKEVEETWAKIAAEYHVSPRMVIYQKMEIMSQAINQGWQPDTLDTSQRKWFPWFTVSSSGLAFSGSYFVYGNANARVGFPFCFESEEKSDYAGKQFIKLWEEFIILNRPQL